MNFQDVKDKVAKLRLEASRKLNHPTTTKAIAAFGEISRRAIHLTAETSALGKLGILGSGIAAFVNMAPTLLIHYPDYDHSQLNSFVNQFTFNALFDRDFLKVDLEIEDEKTYYLKDDPDKNIIWHVYTDGGKEDARAILARNSGDAFDILKRIGKSIWASSKSKRLSFEKVEGSWELLEDPLEEAAPSAVSDTIEAEVKAYNDAGYNRSELLFGPPGTGKSYIARRVAQQRGDYSIRTSFTYDSGAAMIVLAKVLEPRTVIMDDICRGNGNLDMVENLRKHAKLLIATANYTNRLDPAVQRPGRFDSMRLIERLDDEAVKRMLPDLELDVARRIAELPAAYIEEFRVTKEVHGLERAIERSEELKTRAERLQKMIAEDGKNTPTHPEVYDDEDDDEYDDIVEY